MLLQVEPFPIPITDAEKLAGTQGIPRSSAIIHTACGRVLYLFLNLNQDHSKACKVRLFAWNAM
ncbi:MAG: hypothetical protein BGO99_02425 [Nitrosospira sp. 56-18]|nr:MAG: hypothetical protein BGO99_02425 [Nitrosospira sp. 56-18]